jgi:hypothetical protein
MVFAALACGLALLPAAPISAVQEPPDGPRVVVVLVDRTDPGMLATSTAIQGLVPRGAAGLMSTTTGGSNGRRAGSTLAAPATLSAGERAVAPEEGEAPRAVQPGTPEEPTAFGSVGDLYRARTGREPEAALVYPDVGLLGRLNGETTVGAAPGLLGETLRRAGIPTAAVGTSDLPDEPLRPAAILAMDAAGRVAFGSVETDAGQTGEALPIATDLEAIQSATTDALEDARLVIVDWGDTSRVDRLIETQGPRLSERDPSGRTLRDRLQGAREESLGRLDEFLFALNDQLDPRRDVLVILSPTPPVARARAGLDLAPIIVSGGRAGRGSLTSPTTRRPGLVSNVDLAPSILSWLGVEAPEEMVGRPMEARPDERPLRTAMEGLDELASRADSRSPLLAAGLILWLVAVLAGVTAVEDRLRAFGSRAAAGRKAAGRAPQERGTSVLRTLVFASAVVPMILLLGAPVLPDSWVVATLVVVVAAVIVGLVWASGAKRRTASGLGAVGGATLVVLLIDRLLGGPLSWASSAGSEPWKGRGLFGLGPILVGVAIAGATLAAGALARRLRRQPSLRWLALGAAGAILVFLSLSPLGGSPAVGTAGVPALAVGAARLSERPVSKRIWLVAAGAAVLVLLVGAVFLLTSAVGAATPAPESGISGKEAPAALAAIVQERSGRWVRLLLASVWTGVILVSLAAIAYTIVRPRRGPWVAAPRGKGLAAPDRFVEATLVALGVGALLALLVSVPGAASGGVVLMGAALLAVGAALDRVRGLPPRRA